MVNNGTASTERDQGGELSERPVCGLVMPISALDGCDEAHWKDVMSIFSASIKDAGFDPNLVSNDTDVGVIHKRIVQNLYNNPIVLCDVSGKNPNVMFELGMRLAFDKPVIIVKDDKTPYSFDTSPVEHLTYPRDLRFGSIVEFQARLTDKIRAASTGKNSFLASFGTFKVAQIKEEAVGALEIILDEIGTLKRDIRRQQEKTFTDERRVLERMVNERNYLHSREATPGSMRAVFTAKGPSKALNEYAIAVKHVPGIEIAGRRRVEADTDQYAATFEKIISIDAIIERISGIADGVQVNLVDVS